MKRPARFVTETCSMCRRPDWTRQKYYTLVTQEETSLQIKVKGLPRGFTPMAVGCGGSIYEAVKEAIEYCKRYSAKGVGFIFNDKLVTVTAKSVEKEVVDKWWMAVYKETPEQSFARR